MAALALFAYNNVSVTDVTCSWNSKKASNDEVKTIDELYPTRNHQSTSGTISTEALEEFKTSLGMFKNAVGFTWLLRDEPTMFNQIVDIEEIVFSNEYLQATSKLSFLETTLKLSDEKIKEICQKTIGQSSNETWLIARKNRLTSSNFGVILSAIKRNRFPPSLFKRLTGI